jgi:hypothetical protein
MNPTRAFRRSAALGVAAATVRRGLNGAARSVRAANIQSAHAQRGQQLASTALRYAQGATVKVLHHPLLFLGEQQKCSPERATQMVTSFSPVKASKREAAAERPGSAEVYSEGGEGTDTTRADLVCLVATHRGLLQPPERGETLTQRDADSAGDVIVTSSSRPQPIRRPAYGRIERGASHRAESFQQRRDLATAQAVVAKFALTAYDDETCRFEAMQVHTGGRRTYFSHCSEFRPRARASIHQAYKYAGTSRFTDDGSNTCDGNVGIDACIHSSTVDEACGNYHYYP